MKPVLVLLQTWLPGQLVAVHCSKNDKGWIGITNDIFDDRQLNLSTLNYSNYNIVLKKKDDIETEIDVI